MKIMKGAVVALSVLSAAPAAFAGYGSECRYYLDFAMRQPGMESMKSAIDDKFGGDPDRLCACAGVKLQQHVDLDAATAALKFVNDAIEDGAKQEDVDKLLNNSPHSEAAGQFMFGLLGCAQSG